MYRVLCEWDKEAVKALKEVADAKGMSKTIRSLTRKSLLRDLDLTIVAGPLIIN